MRESRAGFTLVEIIIVTLIIGLLAIIAIPGFIKARRLTLTNRFINDLRILTDGMNQVAMSAGTYPPDRGPRQPPAGLSDYVRRIDWNEKTPIGGYWDWDYGVSHFGSLAGFSVFEPDWSAAEMVDIDRRIDDGNLTTGAFRQRTDGYIFEIE